MDSKNVTYNLSNVSINFKNTPLIVSIHDNCHDYSLCLLNYETGEILLHLEYERILRLKGKRIKGEYYNGKFMQGISNVTDRIPSILIGLIDNNIIQAKDIKYYLYYYSTGLFVYKDIYKNFQKGKLDLTNNTRKNYRIPHHLSHLAYSFYTSPFEKSEIFSYDYWGTLTDCMFGYAYNTLSLSQTYLTVIGVGLLYEFSKVVLNMRSGALMGLSPFGKVNKKYENILTGLVNTERLIYGCQKYVSHNKYYALCNWRFHWNKTNNRLLLKVLAIRQYFKFLLISHENILTSPEKEKNAEDFARTTQGFFEKITLDIILKLFKKRVNLCLSGGCALNIYMNELLMKYFKMVYVPPACNDGGQSIGAALYYYYNILGRRRNYLLNQNIAFLGLSYRIDEVELSQFKYLRFSDWDYLLKKTAYLLWSNKIIAWYQGRSESGPRALGNRCILANPCDISNKKKLNCIKRRQPWRPVAPIMTKEAVSGFFEANGDYRYMLFNPEVKNYRRKEIPAVIHTDGTSRVQTVTKEQNKKMYGLLKEFGKLSGIEMLCNTSFNIKEPIVDSPSDALMTFRESRKTKYKIDFLVMGDYLIMNK